LYKEIILKKISVRESEGIARRIAYEKVRKHSLDPDMVEMEEKLTEAFGTRVRIDKKEVGGKILIDFFSQEDIQKLLDAVRNTNLPTPQNETAEASVSVGQGEAGEDVSTGASEKEENTEPQTLPKTDDDGLYSVRNFSV